jgi:hypothetical protein
LGAQDMRGGGANGEEGAESTPSEQSGGGDEKGVMAMTSVAGAWKEV